MYKILVVEDDPNLGVSIKGHLEDDGYQTTLAIDFASGLKEIEQTWDLIILDWQLPDGQGIDLLKKLRENQITTGVIMLTARTELIDKVLGLESGANDYLTKPFEPRGLLARIRVQLRQTSNVVPDDEDQDIHLGPLFICLEQRQVTFHDKKVDFTKMEYDLLKLLADSPNRVFSREEILNKVWGFENFPSTRTVDTHVLQLRNKLDESLFETVRGIGYRLVFSS